MARVLCTLPNASAEISGVRFSEDRGQMLSEEVSDEVAAQFARIPGYRVVAAPVAPAAPAAPPAVPVPPQSEPQQVRGKGPK